MHRPRSYLSVEIGNRYLSLLKDHSEYNKHQISYLTKMAEKYTDHASTVVDAITLHFKKIRSDQKLPLLYLIDSIVKNVKGSYLKYISRHIVQIFCETFEQVDCISRLKMRKLRETWDNVFSVRKLMSLDTRMFSIDQTWPLRFVGISPANSKKSMASKTNNQGNSKLFSVAYSGESKMTDEVTNRRHSLRHLYKQKLKYDKMQQKLVRQANRIKPDSFAANSTLTNKDKDAKLTTMPSTVPLENQTFSSKSHIGKGKNVSFNSNSDCYNMASKNPLIYEEVSKHVESFFSNFAALSRGPECPVMQNPWCQTWADATSNAISGGSNFNYSNFLRTMNHSPPLPRPFKDASKLDSQPSIDDLKPRMNPISSSSERDDPLPYPYCAAARDEMMSQMSSNNFIDLTIIDPKMNESVSSQEMLDCLPSFDIYSMAEAAHVPYSMRDRTKPTITNRTVLPPADPKIIEEVLKDSMKSIYIDGIPREVRYYGEEGVVFMDANDPRDITFQNGTRKVIIDGKISLLCNFNEDDETFSYGLNVYRIKLGAPTRELYVNDEWYECFFGGQPITVDLGNKKVSVKLEGPPPKIEIGLRKRTDLVLGKINLIINSQETVPIFLDAKPQIIEIEGTQCTLHFTDALRKVLLNGKPFKIEFGGLATPIVLEGKRHYLQFSALPCNFRAGNVDIRGMERDKSKKVEPLPEAPFSFMSKIMVPSPSAYAIEPPVPPVFNYISSYLDNSESASSLKSDTLTLTPSSILPNDLDAELYSATIADDIQELLKRSGNTSNDPNIPLFSSSLLDELKKQQEATKRKENLDSDDKADASKQKPLATVSSLNNSYTGKFASEMAAITKKFFKQNRIEQDNGEKEYIQPYLYNHMGWKGYGFKDSEDVDDKAESLEFDDTVTEDIKDEFVHVEQKEEEPSIEALFYEDSFCEFCRKPFAKFFNESKHEWYCRPAIVFEQEIYHPLCLNEHKKMQQSSISTKVDESSCRVCQEAFNLFCNEEQRRLHSLSSVTFEEKKYPLLCREHVDDSETIPSLIDDSSDEEDNTTQESVEIKEENRYKEKEKQSDIEKDKQKVKEESLMDNKKDEEEEINLDDFELIEVTDTLPINIEKINISGDDEIIDDPAKENLRHKKPKDNVPDDKSVIVANEKIEEELNDASYAKVIGKPGKSKEVKTAVNVAEVKEKGPICGKDDERSHGTVQITVTTPNCQRGYGGSEACSIM